MAIWQFSFYMISDKNIHITDFDNKIVWHKPISVNHIDTLGKEQSWSNDILQFGYLDSTCVEILYENGKVQEIYCRLDVRHLCLNELTSILKFAKENHALMFVDNEAYDPCIENMVKLILASNAYKYCANPSEYLLSLR